MVEKFGEFGIFLGTLLFVFWAMPRVQAWLSARSGPRVVSVPAALEHLDAVATFREHEANREALERERDARWLRCQRLFDKGRRDDGEALRALSRADKANSIQELYLLENQMGADRLSIAQADTSRKPRPDPFAFAQGDATDLDNTLTDAEAPDEEKH